VEALVVEARRLGLREAELLQALSARWRELGGGAGGSDGAAGGVPS